MMKSGSQQRLRERRPQRDIHVGLVTLCIVKSAYTSQDLMISRDALSRNEEEEEEEKRGELSQGVWRSKKP